ncbi:hypothetical protein M2271_007460 [Streptomyces sp. LBL]|uniref:hypothetical protein n=1 Tax=Streptomyces sp. LBL TaxID=2940562 RepID=UPI002473A1F6|nr:hypothetical protein [Streptomyces sp. LBL]MDH6629624.1 hypothetical protein [Streptomyces sp. LBL]
MIGSVTPYDGRVSPARHGAPVGHAPPDLRGRPVCPPIAITAAITVSGSVSPLRLPPSS